MEGQDSALNLRYVAIRYKAKHVDQWLSLAVEKRKIWYTYYETKIHAVLYLQQDKDPQNNDNVSPIHQMYRIAFARLLQHLVYYLEIQPKFRYLK